MMDERTLDSEGIPDLEGPLPEKAKTGDPQEGIAPPSEHPASEDYGVTDGEQRHDEPLSERLEREEPDVGDRAFVEMDAETTLVRDQDEAPGVRDDEKDEVARAVDVDGQGLSAEEAAVHVDPER